MSTLEKFKDDEIQLPVDVFGGTTTMTCWEDMGCQRYYQVSSDDGQHLLSYIIDDCDT